MLAANINAPPIRDRQSEFLEVAYKLQALGSFFTAHGKTVECLALNDAYRSDDMVATIRKLSLARDDVDLIVTVLEGLV